MLYTILDVAAEVGFGLLSISTLKKLEKFPIWAEGDDVVHPMTEPTIGSGLGDPTMGQVSGRSVL